MADLLLQAKPRSVVGKQVKALRREGLLPAVLYGRGLDPINIVLNRHEASRALASITSSQLVTVDIDGQQHTGLVREKQRHPVTAQLLHVDFLIVSMTEKLRANIGVVLQGESPAVEVEGGVLVTGLETIEVECLPRDLPEQITLDISTLKAIGDACYVRDVVLPPAVEILTDPEEMLVLVTAQTAEVAEEEEEVEVEVEGEEPEVIERGKREEEEEE